MKNLNLICMLLASCLFFINDSFASVYLVDIHQDADVISGTQWAGENISNQGQSQEIEPIIANDGYNTRHTVYLGFDLFSNNALKDAIASNEVIDSYKLYAYNVRNFAMGDAIIGEVITKIHYVNNDSWWEGPYTNWTTIGSSDPMDGITYNNQVGYNEYLAVENEDEINKWYVWEFSASSFTLGGGKDNTKYLSLAMVPNSLDRAANWWLVSSFASKENSPNPHPYLEVYTKSIIPEPITLFLVGTGLVGAFLRRKRGKIS